MVICYSYNRKLIYSLTYWNGNILDWVEYDIVIKLFLPDPFYLFLNVATRNFTTKYVAWITFLLDSAALDSQPLDNMVMWLTLPLSNRYDSSQYGKSNDYSGDFWTNQKLFIFSAPTSFK